MDDPGLQALISEFSQAHPRLSQAICAAKTEGEIDNLLTKGRPPSLNPLSPDELGEFRNRLREIGADILSFRDELSPVVKTPHPGVDFSQLSQPAHTFAMTLIHLPQQSRKKLDQFLMEKNAFTAQTSLNAFFPTTETAQNFLTLMRKAGVTLSDIQDAIPKALGMMEALENESTRFAHIKRHTDKRGNCR